LKNPLNSSFNHLPKIDFNFHKTSMKNFENCVIRFIRIPVNAKIPKSLHESLVAAVEAEKYKDKTACITEALEKILYNTDEPTQDNTSVLQDKENEIRKLNNILQAKYAEIREIQSVIQSKESEIQRLQGVICEAPDPVELAEVRAHFTGLQRLLEEKDERIKNLNREVEGLQKEVETGDRFI
jgi:hypothetical protein